ncbi:MAG: VOC family protein [Polyangiales bacterium]
MSIVDTYPLLTVSNLRESTDFFVRLGLRPLFEASWIVMLTHEDQADRGSIALGLMTSDHPSRPPGPEVFDGRGMIITLQVDDAKALHTKLKTEGVAIHHELADCPWGQRRFMLRDPSGVLIDVVEQIEPAPGFWEKYQN